MAVSIPVQTKYDGQGFKQLTQAEKQARARAIKMRKLQERHARATLQETKQRIAERKRLLAASRRLERQIEREAKAEERAAKAAEREAAPGLGEVISEAVGGELLELATLEGAVSALADFTVGAFEAGDQAIQTQGTFDSLSGSAEAAAANLAAMERATKDLVSEQEQQAIANSLLGPKVAKTAEELEKVVSVSRRLGKEFQDLGAAEAAEEFALMIQNTSTDRLDSFGISSGRVKTRIDELLKSTEGMTREEAFFQAAMEEAEKTLARLGPETASNADKMAELSARYEDFQASIGKLLLSLGDAGFIDPLIGLVEGLEAGANAWSGFFDQASMVKEALGGVNLAFPATIEEVNNFGISLLGVLNPLSLAGTGISAFISSIRDGEAFMDSWRSALEAQGNLFGDLATDAIKLVTSEEELGQAMAEAAAAANEQTQAMTDNAAAAGDNAAAAEEVSEAVRDAARKLIDINEEAIEDTQDAWGQYYDDLEDLADDSQDRINDIIADSADERIKIQEDLADDILKLEKDLTKDQAKLAKDLAKDLAKLDRDTSKNIRRKQQDFAREDRQQARRRQIDALADERLFQFELRQLESEGQGNAIAAALERRDIEQQIEVEKQANEELTEQKNRAAEIERMKEDAAERAAELKAEAEERAAQLKAEAEEKQRLLEEEAEKEEAQRKAELKQALADERKSFEERRAELGEFVDEKVAKIEEGKKEAIATLAKELQETGDMTESELGQLVDAAGKFGRDAGAAFAEGLRRGAEAISDLDALVPSSPGGSGGGPGGSMPVFQHGGSFIVGSSGGTDSQLVQFMASPGETVTVTPQRQAQAQPITINANGVAADRLASILELKVQEGLQQYNDEVIVPWASGM